MKLEKMRGAYSRATGRVSELCQTSSLGGLGVIWILRPDTNSVVLPKDLFEPLLFFIVALALNFAHYCYRSAAWGWLQWSRERQLADKGDDQPVEDPSEWWNAPSLVLFWAKVVVMAIAFYLLFEASYARLQGAP